nr:PREDICTED: zinc-binding protein A33-like isoform X1 [Lepisosteus oculatus]XP_015206194.1 PREDICTED: zinc-binding protein A33-like isoform X1 [Lepisosteus oculatus]
MDKCSHQQEKLCVFCENDKEALCSQCVGSESHRGHTVISAEKAVQVFRAEMQAKKNHLETLREDAKNQASSREEKLTQLFERLQQFLLRTSIQLETELEDERKVKAQFIQNNIEVVNSITCDVSAQIQSLEEMKKENKNCLDLRTFNGKLERNKKFDFPKQEKSQMINSEFYLGKVAYRLWKQAQAAKFTVHSVTVALDPETAHPELTLFEELTCVRYRGRRLRIPDFPSRFDQCPCVLGTPGFKDGRQYWEVRVWSKKEWDLGMATESANRKGEVRLDPAHGYYTIILREGGRYAACNSPQVPLRPPRQPTKIGIFLDYDRGRLCFLDANNMYPLYTFEHRFTETLFPFFSPGMVIDGQNVEPLKVC